MRSLKLSFIGITFCFLMLKASTASAQYAKCDCSENYGQISAHMKNGQTMEVNGYEVEQISKYKFILSEFSVCNCETKTNLLFLGALREAIVEYKDSELIITELVKLPLGENRQFISVPFSKMVLYSDDHRIYQTPMRIIYSPNIEGLNAQEIINKAKNIEDDQIKPKYEEFIWELAVLAMVGNDQAISLLYNFNENHYKIYDGDIASQTIRAINLVKWFNLK